MLSSTRRVGWGRFSEVDLFTERLEASAETLSQAIRAAASEDPNTDGNVLFGKLQGTVVGLRYYTGVVNQGEMVAMVRQPQNPYDCNAVMVANVYGSQVGHIKRELAAVMAHVMDNSLAKVEGVVTVKTSNSFTMPVSLSFWGKEEDRNTVTMVMAKRGYRLETGEGRPTSRPVMTTSRSARGGMAPPRSLVIPLSADELKNAFDSLFDGLVQSSDGEREAADTLCTPLLPHQRQALSWMCACENSSVLPPFWEKRGGLYYNSLTCFLANERPARVLGGILADDMGLGKTLTTIALILSNFHRGQPLPLEKCAELSSAANSACKTQTAAKAKGNTDPTGTEDAAAYPQVEEIMEKEHSSQNGGKGKDAKAKDAKAKDAKPGAKRAAPGGLHDDCDFAAALSGSGGGDSMKKKTPKRPDPAGPSADRQGEELPEDQSARATLIICPVSVLSNWLDQFEQHVRSDVQLNVYLYYGSERNRSEAFLAAQDVVLTTYSVLSADHGNKSPLHAVHWLRAVLDEGHIIRNPNAQMSKAVLALKAQRRWVLSGTPIQNSVKDMWSLLAFLRLQPFDVKEWWNRVIQRPVLQGDRTGLKNLQTLVKCITLRRTKASEVDGRPLVALPEKTVYLEQIELSQQEREQYELAQLQGRDTINRYVTEGTMMRNYADVLAILMRLRQMCCHPDLVAKVTSDLVGGSTTGEQRERLVERLREVLSSGGDEECSVCLESLRLPVITPCAHVYCQPCIARVISAEREASRCPLCRTALQLSQLVNFPQETQEEEEELPGEWRSSSKVEALLANLARVRSEDASTKCVVVSQFTRFLSRLEAPLRGQGFSFLRLDGSLSQKRRADVIQQFQSPAPGSPSIMLLSLKAGGVGLNLTAASRVFLMDPAWNPAAEDQCIDRCHRLGQKRKVVVTKFIVKDSVEEKMVKIQREKKDLLEKAFGSKKSSRIDDIRALMEI